MKTLAPGDLEQQNMLQTREPEVLGGVEFFVRLRMSHCIIFLHHTPKLGIPVEMIQFILKLLFKHISCCAPRFPLILTSKFHFLYVKEHERRKDFPGGTLREFRNIFIGGGKSGEICLFPTRNYENNLFC